VSGLILLTSLAVVLMIISFVLISNTIRLLDLFQTIPDTYDEARGRNFLALYEGRL
jgi:hypothetical protein